MTHQADSVYQLYIVLKHSDPPIWRRVLVDGSTTLKRLHSIIQIVMPWENYHLHSFEFAKRRFSIPSPYGMDDDEDSRKVRLDQVFKRVKQKLLYIYDFGDNWEHEIIFEKRLPADPQQPVPYCIGGERAGPPEDVGGVWGYERFLEIIKDPTHEQYQDYIEWIDLESFDPDTVDFKAINRKLRR